MQFKELMNKIDQDDEEDEDGNPIGGGGGGNPNYTPSKVNNNPITRGALNNGHQSVTPLKLKLGMISIQLSHFENFNRQKYDNSTKKIRSLVKFILDRSFHFRRIFCF